MKRRELLAGSGALLTVTGWAEAPDEVAVEMQTGAGAITLKIFAKAAPLTAANFLRYVDRRRFDNSSIYRAARDKGTPGVGLIEGGLQNDPARLFPPVPHEPTTQTGLLHGDGAISMARGAPGDATADFFICSGAAPYLDAKPGGLGDGLGYAAFGQVTSGLEVVRAILASPTNAPSRTAAMQGQMLDAPVPITRVRRV